jgi:hypothetical protein
MVRRRTLFVALAAATAACAGLKSAEIANQAGPDGGSGNPAETHDSGVKIDDAGDLVLPDGHVVEPPSDFTCDGDPWINATKTRSDCSPRRVMVVDDAQIDTSYISIGRTPKGRVGIAYNSNDPTSGKFHLAHWIPDSPTAEPPTIIVRPAPDYFHDGADARVIGVGPDTLQLLTFDYSDVDGAGSVNLAQLVDGKGPITQPDLVLDAVPNPTEIGFALDSKGTPYSVIRVSSNPQSATLVTRTKPPNGAWTTTTPIPEVDDTLTPKVGPGVGASWLNVDDQDVLHVLYHWDAVPVGSNPRFHTFEQTTWTYRKTLDNQTLDGVCGYNPRLTTFNGKKYALFYFRKGGQDAASATADLRLATWSKDDDTPEIEILDQQIPSSDLQEPHYRAAMAIDAFGLVHLALVSPQPSNTGVLEYRRQSRNNDGSTKWLSDIVDPNVLTQTDQAFVDLIVDENARPHIAYRSGADLKIRYATRYDR